MDRSDERTETDERVAENAAPAPRTSVVGAGSDAPLDPATGLPLGQHDDDRSPLDRNGPLDPFRGKTPAERAGHEPSRAERQAFMNEPATDSNATSG